MHSLWWKGTWLRAHLKALETRFQRTYKVCLRLLHWLGRANSRTQIYKPVESKQTSPKLGNPVSALPNFNRSRLHTIEELREKVPLLTLEWHTASTQKRTAELKSPRGEGPQEGLPLPLLCSRRSAEETPTCLPSQMATLLLTSWPCLGCSCTKTYKTASHTHSTTLGTKSKKKKKIPG